MNYINTNEFILEDNKIKITPDKIFTYRTEKTDTINKNNKIFYNTQYIEKEVRYKDFKNYREIKLNFDLLDLNYIFYAPNFYNVSNCIGTQSTNELNNIYLRLINSNIIDKRIKSCHNGKGYNTYGNYWNNFKDEWDYIFYNINSEYREYGDIDIFLYDYGWGNSLWHTIDIEDVLKLPIEKIKKYAPNLINLFKYIGVNLNNDYDKKIKQLYKNKELITI